MECVSDDASCAQSSTGISSRHSIDPAVSPAAGTSPQIENYFGFPAGISGTELAHRATIQAEKFGTEIIVPAVAIALAQGDGRYTVRVDDALGLPT
jgi:thioredoxin reductase (NADPH)